MKICISSNGNSVDSTMDPSLEELHTLLLLIRIQWNLKLSKIA